jgi:hypothetical protein
MRLNLKNIYLQILVAKIQLARATRVPNDLKHLLFSLRQLVIFFISYCSISTSTLNQQGEYT